MARDAGLASDRTARAFLWVVRVTAVMTLLVFAAAAWRIVRGEGGATLGWTESRSAGAWYVAGVAQDGPAVGVLQPGDRLVAFNGDPWVATFGTSNYRKALRIGDRYELQFERDGVEHSAFLATSHSTTLLMTRLSWFLVSLVWCVIGLFMGFVRPDRPMARLAFLTGMAVGFVFVQVSLFSIPTIYQPLHVVLGYHFFYRFPGAVPLGGFWTALLWLLYAASLLPIGVGQVMSWKTVVGGPPAHLQWMGSHQTIFSAGRTLNVLTYDIAVVGMVAVIVRNYRLLREPDQRRRIRWVVYCSTLGLLPQFWDAGVSTAQLVGRLGNQRINELLVNAATCAIPISVAYAVVKHRLFDIKVVVRRGLQYLLARRLLQIFLALPIVALAYAVFENRDRTIAELLTGNAVNVVFIAMLTASVRFRDPLRLWLDRRFFREQYDSERILIGLVDELGRARSPADVSNLVRAEIERALHPKILHWWRRDGEETPVPLAPSVIATLARQASPVEVADIAAANSRDAGSQALLDLGVQLVVPVTSTDGRVSGALLLGEKQSEEPYSAIDRRLLHAVAAQVAVVWDKLRLQAQVGEEQRIRREVIARVDRGLAQLLKECPTCGRCYDPDEVRCADDGHELTWSLPIERVLDGKYRLDRLIGRGGMGAVYEARDLNLGRSIAVKFMTGGGLDDEAALRRFQREARAAASLNHPHIVSIYDYGTVGGRGAFLVMERLHGHTMRAALSREGRLAPIEAALWFDQLLDGLEAAHAHGIVHRDLKPENIFGETSNAGALAVKILDFGVAKFRPAASGATATVTVGGAIVGTFGYMSPEQLTGAEVDARSDLFSVGVMVVEALTGSRPFRGDTYPAVLHAVSHEVYHLPGSSPRVIALDALLQRSLARNPRDRIDSAASLRAALTPALRACPPFAGWRTGFPGDLEETAPR